jgi:hypothetical protein
MTCFRLSRPTHESSFTLLLCAFLLAPGRTILGQVGDTSGTTYPNWTSSDKVLPVVRSGVSYDSVAHVWRYSYTVSNGAAAQQAINDFTLNFSGNTPTASQPNGWDGFVLNSPSSIPGAVFLTVSDNFTSVAGGVAAAPTTAQIAPGQMLSGFSLTSPYPPGDARTYIRGYSAVPFLPDSVEDSFVVPADTTDAQRGWALGPTRYTAIVTQGTQEAADLARANRFVSFMNVDTVGTTLGNPAVIAIKFDDGSDGDFVVRQSFRALLNGVDVTSSFHPGPSDGADLVAVFEIGPNSPLTSGQNTLKTFVTGLPSTFSASAIPSVVDTDTIVFTVLQ